jgi:hypothetical protein
MSAKLPIKLEASCCMCAQTTKVDVPLSEGWRIRYNIIYEEAAFCPQHSLIESFLEEQCPGCMCGWPQCPMFEAFAYSGQETVTDADYETLERGICPRRANGTMTLDPLANGRAENVDLSSPAVEGGVALASAIRQYIGGDHER